jgi:S-adenosylmethionine:diacylglycerol 3-amino-3-carboxypropyl transferase
MLRSILGLAAIGLASPAIGSDEWVQVSSSTDSGSVHSVRMVDLPTWSPGNRANKVWVKSDMTKQEGVSFSRVIALNVVDCPGRKFQALSIRAYYRDGTDEELPTDPDRTMPLPPGSVIARVADIVCHAPRDN